MPRPLDTASRRAYNLGMASKLKAARAAKGWSQRDLARHTNGIVTHYAIAQYEMGACHPSEAVLIILALTLNVTPDDLRGG